MKSKLDQFYELKSKRRYLKDLYREKSLTLRREMHKEFVQKHKKMFILMDVLFILAIVFNIGALLITGAIVTKTNPTQQFTEGNPIQAQIHNWSYDQSKINEFVGVISNIIEYMILIAGYIFYRRYVYSEMTFIIAIITVATFTFGLGYDFSHDLGLLIGRSLV